MEHTWRFRNLKYEDYMSFLCEGIHHGCPNIFKIIIKILNAEYLSTDDISSFMWKKLSYESTQFFCLHLNEPMKIVKYFHKLIQEN